MIRVRGREPAEFLRWGLVPLSKEPVPVPSGSVPRTRCPDPAPGAVRTSLSCRPSHPLLVAPWAEG